MAEFTVSTESAVAGRTLHDIDFRRRYGVSIVAIRRGNRLLQLPGGGTQLFPYDKLTVVGTDEEFRNFRRILEQQRSERRKSSREARPSTLRIVSYTLPADSALDGLTLRDAEVREHASALVLGIERAEGAVMNPPATESFHAGDTVWAVGDPHRMQAFFERTKGAETAPSVRTE